MLIELYFVYFIFDLSFIPSLILVHNIASVVTTVYDIFYPTKMIHCNAYSLTDKMRFRKSDSVYKRMNEFR
jgi:hypothetical protein